MFRAIINSMNNISIKSKLLVLVLVSLGLALFFGAIHIWGANQDKQEMTKISSLVELSTDMSGLMHESQRERGMSAGFIGSEGRLFTEKLPEQHIRFDQFNQILLSNISKLDTSLVYGKQKAQLEKIQALLAKVPEIRQQVLSLTIKTGEVVAFYTALNESLLSYMEYLTHVSTNAEVTEKILAFTSFLEAKERAGLERALLANTFLSDKFSEGAYQKFVSLVAVQHSYIHLFKATATDENIAFYEKSMAAESIQQVEEYRTQAHKHAVTGGFSVDPTVWFDVISLKIKALKGVENQLTESLLNRVHEILNEKNQSLMFASLMLILGVLIVISLSHIIVKAMNSSVSMLKNTMAEIESTGNLSLRVPVSGRDEFAQIATAYNRFTNNFKVMIDDTNGVLDKIANGDFTGRMDLQVSGDLEKLQKGVNGSATSVEFMMSQLSVVMDGLAVGDFAVRMDQKVPQAFRAKVDNSLEVISSAFEEMQAVMTAMQEGEYSSRVDSDLPGELNDMKQSINAALNGLESGVDEISQVMAAQAQGELSLRIQGQYQGRLDELKMAINNSSEKMSTAISDVKKTASTVRTASTEVAQGSDSLSERAQTQAASLEETAASIEEMTSTINQATTLAEQASSLSSEAIVSSQKGSEVMSETVVAMERINEVSVSINDIISLIDNIAFQTNLLALNAAVEAARAGEHGRGFAVVAGEVRNLAGRSADAAKEIKELIEKTTSEVSIGTDLVKSSGEALTGINEQIEKISSMVSEIAKGSKEQASGIDQINIAMASLDQTTQENAALVEQTASSAEHMAGDAEVLEEIVGKFRIDEGVPRLTS